MALEIRSLHKENASNLALVHLTFAVPFANRVTNTLTLTNVSDLAGNPITSTTAIFSFVVARQFDVVIDEIMADPTPQIGLPNAEFVEIKKHQWQQHQLAGLENKKALAQPALHFLLMFCLLIVFLF